MHLSQNTSTTLAAKPLRVYGLLLFAWVLLLASGGATNSFSQILTLTLTGLLLILIPPAQLPERRLSILLGALTGWILISSWMPFPFFTSSQWLREVHDVASATSSSLSAQPFLSMEKLLYMLCGLAWLVLVYGVHMNRQKRILVIKGVVGTGSLMALVIVLGIKLNWQHPLTWGTHRFSFFPNHNQTGILLALSGILTLSLAIRCMRRRSWFTLIYLGSLALICFAMLLGMSRSAVLMFGAGASVTVLLSLNKRNHTEYLKIGIPFALVLLASAVLYGGHLLDEFVSMMQTGGIQEELRLFIYLDTIGLIRAFPLFGIGLGNFRYHFPFFHQHADTMQSIHHPESDVLWIWSELGLVGLLLTGLIVLQLILRLAPLQTIRERSSRSAPMIACLVFCIAGMIEVSGHRLGTALFAVLLWGMAQSEPGEMISNKWIRPAFRTLGVSMVLLGMVWAFHLRSGSPFTVEEVNDYANQPLQELLKTRSLDELELKLDSWQRRYPLLTSLHTLRGIIDIEKGGPIQVVNTSFHTAQSLNPRRWQIPIHHGIYLHAADFNHATQHWIYGIERSEGKKLQAFWTILRSIDRSLYPRLSVVVNEFPELRYAFLTSFSSSVYSKQLETELARNPTLKGFSNRQKLSLLWTYTQINGIGVLQRLLEQHPELGEENWILQSRLHAGLGQHQLALELAISHVPAPEMPDLTGGRSLFNIRAEYLSSSQDPLKVIALVQKLYESQSYREIVTVITSAREKGIQHPFLRYKMGISQHQLGLHSTAWTEFERILAEMARFESSR